MARDKDFYTEVREANRRVWNGILDPKKLQTEWNAGVYGDNLPDGNELLGAGDTHAGITAAEVGAVVFDSADALKTSMDTVAGNMQKLL